jgi:polyphosphate glucokinase
VFNFDRLYLGGGNSSSVKFKLPRNVSLVSNNAGMEGGAYAWRTPAQRRK